MDNQSNTCMKKWKRFRRAGMITLGVAFILSIANFLLFALFGLGLLRFPFFDIYIFPLPPLGLFLVILMILAFVAERKLKAAPPPETKEAAEHCEEESSETNP